MHSFDAAASGWNELRWRKSSHSGGGNDCVEVAFIGMSPMLRDSKDPDGGVISLSASEWRSLLDRIGAGELDLS